MTGLRRGLFLTRVIMALMSRITASRWLFVASAANVGAGAGGAGGTGTRRPTTYRVILKLDGSEFEIGSIGIQHGAAWRWGIDTVIPMRVLETEGKGEDRGDLGGGERRSR
jgi:hypothetical protein